MLLLHGDLDALERRHERGDPAKVLLHLGNPDPRRDLDALRDGLVVKRIRGAVGRAVGRAAERAQEAPRAHLGARIRQVLGQPGVRHAALLAAVGILSRTAHIGPRDGVKQARLRVLVLLHQPGAPEDARLFGERAGAPGSAGVAKDLAPLRGIAEVLPQEREQLRGAPAEPHVAVDHLGSVGEAGYGGVQQHVRADERLGSDRAQRAELQEHLEEPAEQRPQPVPVIAGGPVQGVEQDKVLPVLLRQPSIDARQRPLDLLRVARDPLHAV